MSIALLTIIRQTLTIAGVQFRELHHEETHTSEESAKARGEPLKIGAKALIVKTDGEPRLFVLPADRSLDSKAVKRELKVKDVRFATKEEVLALTGLIPGAIPPFGKPLLPFDLFVDPTLAENEKIAFNAGTLTDSIILATGDYIRIAKPTMLSFASAPKS